MRDTKTANYRHDTVRKWEAERSSDPPYRVANSSRILSGWIELSILVALRRQQSASSTQMCMDISRLLFVVTQRGEFEVLTCS